MKTKKLSLEDFTGCRLREDQKIKIKGGDPTNPIELEPDGPSGSGGGYSNGDVKPPVTTIVPPITAPIELFMP